MQNDVARVVSETKFVYIVRQFSASHSVCGYLQLTAMGGDIEHWKRCLVSSIQLFCRNFCQYDSEARIDGLLAITLDKKEVILVKLQETDNSLSTDNSGPANQPSKEQSEQLESILRYLAPSCRLLKKAPVRAAALPSIPQVWKPITDGSGSADTPDRCAFLRSLGLVPTAVLAANRSTDGSCIARLKATVGLETSLSDGCSPSMGVDSCKYPKGSGFELKNDTADEKFLSGLPKSDKAVKGCRSSSVKHSGKHHRMDIKDEKTDANGNKKLTVDVKCSRPCGPKSKVPLASSHSVNCSTNVRVCLGDKSLNLMTNENKTMKLSGSSGGGVLKKQVKLSRKRHISNSMSRAASHTKISSDSGAKRSKSTESNILQHKNDTSSSQGRLKRTYNKRKITHGKVLKCPASCKQHALPEKNKTGSKPKDSARLSTSLARDFKKKIASQKLLNKTKVSLLTFVYFRDCFTGINTL